MITGIAIESTSESHWYFPAVRKSSRPTAIEDLATAPTEIRQPSIAKRKVKLDRMFITASTSFPRKCPANSVFPKDENVVPKRARIVGVRNLL